jgi:hypothetical protein
MKGDKRGRKEVSEFRIRWVQFGSESETWEPWKNHPNKCRLASIYEREETRGFQNRSEIENFNVVETFKNWWGSVS